VKTSEARGANPLRAVYLLSSANFVWAFGYGLYGYVFPKFLASVGATPPDIGLVATILIIAQAITYVPGGILSDAGHRRKLVIASWLFAVLAPPFFILAELTGQWLNVIPGILIFAANWIGVPAVQSYVTEAAPKEKAGLSFGILVSSSSVGLIASPLIGGFIIERSGFVVLFIISFVLYATSTFMVLAIPKFPGDINTNKLKARNNTESGVGKVNTIEQGDTEVGTGSSLRRLRPIVALCCCFLGVVALGSSFIPLYLSDQYGFGYVEIQVMYTILNLSAIFITTGLGKISDRYSPANKVMLITIPITAYLFAYYILLTATNILILPVSFVLMGSLSALFPLVYSVVAELSGGKRLGRIYGVVGTFLYGAQATTPYIGGILYNIGKQMPFFLTLMLTPLLLILAYVAHKKTH
jgi:DHA1 family multidrug resistance protein-like MFS transporter